MNMSEIKSFISSEDYNNYANKTQKEIQDTGKIIENIYIKNKITIKKQKIPVNQTIYQSEEELSESLRALIKKVRNSLASRSKALEGIRSEVHIQPLEPVKDKKSIKAEFPEDGGVIINKSKIGRASCRERV